MACGYAMYSGRLGVCFATAGPGAFNLFSGLAVAMSDSYPVLAISGFASLDWKGKGALNETSGVSRTPDSQAMFAATTKKSYLLEDAAKTCDVLEEAVNLAFEGRPGPVHIHVPENLTHDGISVDNYRDIELDVNPCCRIRPRRRGRRCAGRRAAEGQAVLALIGFGAIRSNAGPGIASAAGAVSDPLRHHARRQGHHFRGPPAVGRAYSATAATSRAARRSVAADVVLAVGNSFAQHATFNFRDDLFEDKKLIHINIDVGRDRQGLQGRRGDHRRRQAGDRGAAQDARRCSIPSRRGRSRHDYSHERIIHLGRQDSIRARWRRRCRSCFPTTPSCLPTRAPTSPGSAITWMSARAAVPQAGRLWPDGRARERRARRQNARTRTGPSSSAVATAATCCRASSS